jgi:hypothetical protein
MKLRLDKPWMRLDEATVRRLPGQLGVYQLADSAGRVLYIGYAGGRSLFGLRGEIGKHAGGEAAQFRYEVNMQYQTRYRELLMLHHADHAELPPMNQQEPPIRLGRLG